MALIAMAAAAAWGMFNQAVENRTQWKYLQAQGRELDIQSKQIRSIGAAEIRLFHRQAQYRMGAIEAGWGHSGVSADSGSAFEVLMAQAATDGLTKLQIQRNTDIQARNMDVSRQFSDYRRKIMDQQLPLQLITAASYGIAAGSGTGSTSFGTNFLAAKTTPVGSAQYGSSQIGSALGI